MRASPLELEFANAPVDDEIQHDVEDAGKGVEGHPHLHLHLGDNDQPADGLLLVAKAVEQQQNHQGDDHLEGGEEPDHQEGHVHVASSDQGRVPPGFADGHILVHRQAAEGQQVTGQEHPWGAAEQVRQHMD